MAITPVQLAEAMGCALILLVVIIAIADIIVNVKRQQTAGKPGEKSDFEASHKSFILVWILQDENDHASLSSFQFLMWTLLIAFFYTTLWFLQFLNHIPGAPPDIPADLMILMGISIAVPISGQVIEGYKQNKPRPEGQEYKSADYSSMLEERDQPSLLRFQMFLWTLAALVIYSGLFITGIFAETTVIGAYGLPPVNETFLFLMGLSQTGYLGSKVFEGTVEKTETAAKTKEPVQPASTAPAAAPVSMAIREIIPRDTVRTNELITLLGTGFGNTTDTLMLGDDRVDPVNIKNWRDERIEFTLPENTKPGALQIRILAGGKSASAPVTVSGPKIRRGFNNVDAEIISEIWIDDPTMKGYRCPPIGHFIPNKRYHFFFEFAVPEGTPEWGMTQFGARFSVDGKDTVERNFMPGHTGGKNYGVFDYIFKETGTYTVEIKGAGAPKTMNVEVKPGNE